MSQAAFDKALGLKSQIEAATIDTPEALEAFRIEYLGSKNVLKALFGAIKEVENTRKKEYGQLVNSVKQVAEAKYAEVKAGFEAAQESKGADFDLTAPGEPLDLGARHPISIVMNQIVDIFKRVGFTVAENREIEDEWHNFSALNTPDDHPARDMQDTFYLRDDFSRVLRSQTSTAQVHVMENQEPPIRIISPGRVYRNETISARAHCQFHQVEGLYIDKNVSFADLKQMLLHFAREMYGPDTKIRLRPSYFPFTEPSAEMDIYWGLNNEVDYRITKGTGWLEILGCGMVDPAVLKNCGIDPDEYTGYAFGMGIERQAMLKYRIDDIRLLFENDARFLEQFASAY